MNELCIITGVSGAGKSTLIYTFEEMGYYIVENVPFPLIDSLFNLFKDEASKYEKCALTVSLEDALKVYELAKKHCDFKVRFIGLDCSKNALLERFKLTRHLHPLQAKGIALEKALQIDSELMFSIKSELTYYLDTSKLTVSELRKWIYDNVLQTKDKLTVNFCSFGFKKMIPQDLDMIFDTRMMPNPFWVNDLRELTGLDEDVQKYVLDSSITKEYLAHAIDYLDFYLAKLQEEGRSSIMIGIGCSGGQHRSVTIANYLKKHYAKKYHTVAIHRDIPR